MFKIAVFGFNRSDEAIADASPSPVDAGTFMRTVWQMEPPESRIGAGTDVPCFVKLTRLASRPIYVQRLSEQMTPGAGLLNADGYVAIIDAVKVLAPQTIQRTLQRLAEQQPNANLIIAAGRQNEPGAHSSEDLREMLKLHADLPIYPYVPAEPETVHRLVERLVRHIGNPDRIAPPVFAGGQPVVVSPVAAAPVEPIEKPVRAPAPSIDSLAHVAITVSDLERSLEFYRGLLGFRLLGHLDFPHDERGYTITYLDAGRVVLKLFSYANTEAQTAPAYNDTRTGWQHVALRVTGMDVIVEQLRCAGVQFVREPAIGQSGARIAFLTDPDGTMIELIEGDLVYTRR